MQLLHVIADYSAGDLAFSEMVAALAAELPEGWTWLQTPVPSFNTVATGFVVAQLGLRRSALLFANCAPRQDQREARDDNAGEGLLYGVLSSGTPLLVVNSGFSLSFVREHLTELWSTNVPDSGSQFPLATSFRPTWGGWPAARSTSCARSSIRSRSSPSCPAA